NHLLCELPIELGPRQAAQVIVHFLLLCIRLGRRRHPHLLSFLFGLLQVLTVILLQHLTVAFHVLALSFLLRKLAHIDFRKRALNRVVEESLGVASVPCGAFIVCASALTPVSINAATKENAISFGFCVRFRTLGRSAATRRTHHCPAHRGAKLPELLQRS